MRPLSFMPTDIPGCVAVLAQHAADDRGSFSKVFHEERFREAMLPERFAEWYHTFSRPHVLRGLHFQAPPKAQGKLVFCLAGRVLDVGVDVRQDSPAFGRHVAVELSPEEGNGLYLPPGIAHGYCVLGDEPATMLYGATELFDAELDGGIAWDSAGVPWPYADPVLSVRDTQLPSLEAFASPFRCDGRQS